MRKMPFKKNRGPCYTMQPQKQFKRACLVVIDGWGLSSESSYSKSSDAIKCATTKNMTQLMETCPFCPLSAHGLSVGLPDGLMGNSEVGHLNIGAGRIVYQDIVRIDLAFKSAKFQSSAELNNICDHAKANGSRLHLIGLISNGGVHSHIDHLKHLLIIIKELGVEHVFIHCITDGRDVSPKSAALYLNELDSFIKNLKYGTISTIFGRYYAMDRDKRWERTEEAYDALVSGEVEVFDNFDKLLDERYRLGETDEFFKPAVSEESKSRIQDQDAVLFFNFRSDRMRQLVSSFARNAPNFCPKRLAKNLVLTSTNQNRTSLR